MATVATLTRHNVARVKKARSTALSPAGMSAAAFFVVAVCPHSSKPKVRDAANFFALFPLFNEWIFIHDYSLFVIRLGTIFIVRAR